MHWRLPLLLALVTLGCAYRTPAVHVPDQLEEVPGPRDASDITVRGATDAEAERDVQATARKLLDGVGGIVHMRVVLEERDDYANNALSKDGIAVFGLWPVAFGMIYESETIAVDVEIEAHGRFYRGHGEAKKEGGLYAHARRRALAAALDRALAEVR